MRAWLHIGDGSEEWTQVRTGLDCEEWRHGHEQILGTRVTIHNFIKSA